MTNLKRIIDEKGVQQRWLAEAVGVTEVSMSRYVSGERIPKAPIAIRMADALGVNVKDLYGWESEKRTEERTETNACDLISRQAAIDAIKTWGLIDGLSEGQAIEILADEEKLPSAQPEIIRCHQCGFWDRDTLQHNFNDFRDWNEAECLVLAERDGYHEINRYTEADDFCSRAERRTDEGD